MKASDHPVEACKSIADVKRQMRPTSKRTDGGINTVVKGNPVLYEKVPGMAAADKTHM